MNASSPSYMKHPENMQLAIDAAEIGIWNWHVTSNLISWSENLEKIHGLNPGEFNGTFDSFVEVVYPDDRKRIFSIIEQAVEECSSFEFEHRWIRTDGKIIWMRCKGKAYPGPDNQTEHMTGICMEITERKKNEYSDALLSAVVNGSDDAIISKNLNSVITSWNPGAKKIFGYTEKEAVGKNILMIFPSERTQEEVKIINRLKKGERIDHFETVRRRKDGSFVDISLTVSPIRDRNGIIVGASKIARDITQQKRAEKRLQEMNETLERRVEKRTQSLLSYQKQLRSLASRLSKAEEQERRRLATELHDNLGQLLALAKMKLDSLQVLPAKSNEISELNDLLEDSLTYTRNLMSDLKPPPTLDKEDVRVMLDWLVNKMKKHNLKVIIEDDERPKRVSKKSRNVLLQCIRELLFNVIKHTECNEARIKISSSNHSLKVSVEDHGNGIPSSRIKKASNNGRFGLFNIKERIDLLGGRVDISSAPGRGTKVALLLPMDEENNPPEEDMTQSEEQRRETSNNEQISVLLVDDHKMMREGLQRIVDEEEDLNVIGMASDGKEGVKLAKKLKPNIVVMDVNMPVMDGIDATKKITSILPDIRVVGLSLHDHREVKESMRSAGASAYLVKNEASESLCATIRSEAHSLDS